MTKPDDSKPEEHAPPPTAVDVENQREGGGVTNIVQRWRREDLLKRGSLAFRAFGFVFSLLAFIIMATNQHGDGREFDRYEEYRYVLAIAILSTLYTGLQTWKQIHEIYTSREIISRKNAAVIDFAGDQDLYRKMSLQFSREELQLPDNAKRCANRMFDGKVILKKKIVAYLLLSAASSAVPLTNSMRQGSDNLFTDSSASAISMGFFAFFSLGLSALISGYKLSSQTYI